MDSINVRRTPAIWIFIFHQRTSSRFISLEIPTDQQFVILLWFSLTWHFWPYSFLMTWNIFWNLSATNLMKIDIDWFSWRGKFSYFRSQSDSPNWNKVMFSIKFLCHVDLLGNLFYFFIDRNQCQTTQVFFLHSGIFHHYFWCIIRRFEIFHIHDLFELEF